MCTVIAVTVKINKKGVLNVGANTVVVTSTRGCFKCPNRSWVLTTDQLYNRYSLIGYEFMKGHHEFRQHAKCRPERHQTTATSVKSLRWRTHCRVQVICGRPICLPQIVAEPTPRSGGICHLLKQPWNIGIDLPLPPTSNREAWTNEERLVVPQPTTTRVLMATTTSCHEQVLHSWLCVAGGSYVSGLLQVSRFQKIVRRNMHLTLSVCTHLHESCPRTTSGLLLPEIVKVFFGLYVVTL